MSITTAEFNTLGHSAVVFTLDVHSASLPDLQEGAAEKLEGMLGG